MQTLSQRHTRSFFCGIARLGFGTLALVVSHGRVGAQHFETTVRSDSLVEQNKGVSSVTVIELGLPGQKNAPSAAKTSVAELLDGQPGVFVRRSGGLGQFSGASLRGSAPGQVAVFLDGIPLLRGGQSAVDLSQFPPDALSRVEIYRGIPPLWLGSETLGGAVHLVTRTGQGTPSAWLNLGSGSFGLRRASAGYKGPTPALSLSIAYQAADGDFPYLFNEGLRYGRDKLDELRRKNDGFDQVSLDVRLKNPISLGHFFVHGSGFWRRQGVAGIGAPNAQPGQPELETARALFDAGVRLASPTSRVAVELSAHALLERVQTKDLQVAPPVLLEHMSQQVGQKTLARFRANPSASPQTLHLLTLLEFRYERLEQRNLCPAPRLDCQTALAADSDRFRGVLSLGGELSIADGRLLFDPGVHLLLVRSNYKSLSDRDTEVLPPELSVLPSPQVAARVVLRPWLLLRVGAGRFVRLPTFLELFGDGAFYRKSLGLRPESSWTGELGVEANGQPFSLVTASFGLYGFGRNIDDLIDIVRDGPTLRARNVGQAVAAGLECSTAVRVGDFLSVEGNYTFLDSRDRTDQPDRNGKMLPGRPSHTLFFRTEAAHRPARIFYELDVVSSLFLDPANLVERPTRTLHAVGVALGPLTRFRVSLRVEMRNLLDTRTVLMALPLQERPTAVPLSDYFDYPLPGRALFATLSGRL